MVPGGVVTHRKGPYISNLQGSGSHVQYDGTTDSTMEEKRSAPVTSTVQKKKQTTIHMFCYKRAFGAYQRLQIAAVPFPDLSNVSV